MAPASLRETFLSQELLKGAEKKESYLPNQSDQVFNVVTIVVDRPQFLLSVKNVFGFKLLVK
jgi:hypothetical protein